MKELIICALLLTGTTFVLVAALGLLRLPDVYCRAHAVAKATTLGMTLLLLGLWIHLDDAHAGFKILLAIIFQIVTLPVASHLLALAAYRQNVPRWKSSPLKDYPERVSTDSQCS